MWNKFHQTCEVQELFWKKKKRKKRLSVQSVVLVSQFEFVTLSVQCFGTMNAVLGFELAQC